VEVINAGVCGYDSSESLINLIFRVLEIQPDLIIVYHGTNDVHARMVVPGFYRGDNSGRRRQWQLPRVHAIERSVLLRIVCRRLGVTSQTGLETLVNSPAFVGAVSETAMRARPDVQMAALDANPPVYFARNLRCMAAVARVHGVPLMFSTWAHCPHAGDYAATAPYQRGFSEGNATVLAAAAELDVPVFDFAAVMSTNLRYWADGRHVNEEGARLKAELFAAFLHEQALVPAPADDGVLGDTP
jgi:lysophospholipase L1-like esterase